MEIETTKVKVDISVIEKFLRMTIDSKFKIEFSLEELMNYSSRFRGFRSVKEVRTFLQPFVESGSVVKEKKKLIFKDDKESIVIPLEIFPSFARRANRDYLLQQFKKSVARYSELQLLNKITQTDDVAKEICTMENNRLASYDEGGKVNVYKYDIPSKTCLPTLSIKSDWSRGRIGVGAICALDGTKVASCGDDNIIKIWEISENNCEQIYTLKGHADCVSKIIKLDNGKIASCSRDGELRIWDNNNNYTCEKTIIEDQDKFRTILGTSKYIVSVGGLRDRKMKMWDIKTYLCDKTIRGIFCLSVNGLATKNGKKIIVGGNGKLGIIKIPSFRVKVMKKNSLGEIWTICYFERSKFLIGNKEGTISCLDLSSKKILFAVKLHNDAVLSIVRGSTNFVFFSTSKDKTINMMKLV